jgi:hypothetical protein
VQYALMIYVAPAEYEGLSEEERPAVSAEYYALREDSRVVGAAALRPVESATTVRGRAADSGAHGSAGRSRSARSGRRVRAGAPPPRGGEP